MNSELKKENIVEDIIQSGVTSKFYDKYGKRDLLWKYNINDVLLLNNLKQVRLGVSWSNLKLNNYMKLIGAKFYIKGLVGLNSYHVDRGVTGGQSGLNPEHVIINDVWLRKKYLNRFLDYFYFVIMPLYKERLGVFRNKEVMGAMYVINVKDLNVFFLYKDDLNFDEPMYISFDFYKSSLVNNYIINFYGI